MAGLERKLTRLDEGSSSEGRHDSDDEENRSRHSADSKLSADESDGPLHRAASPLDGVAATQQSIERHSGRHPLTQVVSRRLLPLLN